MCEKSSQLRFNQLLDTTFTEGYITPLVNKINDERKDYIHLGKYGQSQSSFSNFIEDEVRE